MENKEIETQALKKDTWEIKDRMYYLKNNVSPLTYTIRSSNIYYFDEEKGYERELKYTSNQRTPFVDDIEIKVFAIQFFLFQQLTYRF